MEDIISGLFLCLIIPLAMALLVFTDKSKKLFVFLLSGIFLCLYASRLNALAAYVSHLSIYTLTTSVTPVIEEAVKMIPIIVLAFIIKSDRQTLLECAVMVGIGFSTMENLYVLISNAANMQFIQVVSRGLGAAMLHTTTSLIVAYGISYCKVRKKTFITGTYAMFVGATVFHGMYNMLVQSEKYEYFGILLPTCVFIPLAITIVNQKKHEKERNK